MPQPPPEIAQWLKRTYPRPSVDPEWLEGCYTWIQDELHLNPAREMPAILEHVNTQLLESDFADSMVAGTGIPLDVLGAEYAQLQGPILVEVTEIMEIGHSAWSLLQVQESRVEYCKQAELRDARGDEEERKPMPKYPRSMLKFQLSDGTSILPAIEFKSLPQFELGETPLGCKMIVKDITIRRGSALLEPKCVVLKGHRTADRDDRREEIFTRSLKRRLGEVFPEDEPPAPEAQHPPPRAAAPNGIPPPRHSLSPASRSPLRDISPPPSPKAGPSNAMPSNILEHEDDAGQPRRRKLPKRAKRSPSPEPPPREEVLQRSRYFAQTHGGTTTGSRAKPDADPSPTTGSGTAETLKKLARVTGMSPPRRPPIEIPSGDESEDDRAASPSPPRATKANGESAQKQTETETRAQKQKQKESVFGDLSSDDFGFDFDVDDNFIEQLKQFEDEGYNRAGSSGTSGRTQTHVKTEVFSQMTSATLVGTDDKRSLTAAGSASRGIPALDSASDSHATPLPSTSSSGSKDTSRRATVATADVITISDEEEELDKENMPVQTRHVRRRVAPVDDVIELSD